MNKKETGLELAEGVAKEAAKEIVEERSFAFNILQDLRAANQRLWWALIIVLVFWGGTIGGFFWLLWRNV